MKWTCRANIYFADDGKYRFHRFIKQKKPFFFQKSLDLKIINFAVLALKRIRSKIKKNARNFNGKSISIKFYFSGDKNRGQFDFNGEVMS